MRLIDLTLPPDDPRGRYPGDPPVQASPLHTLEQHGWRLHAVSLGSHAGTHVNAPWHMAPEGDRLEELSLDRLCGWAVVRGAGPVAPGLGLIYADFPLEGAELEAVLEARPPFVAQAVEFPLDLEAERALCLAGIVSFENLDRTALLPRGVRFWFMGLASALAPDGFPVRAAAVLEPWDHGFAQVNTNESIR
ncbi:Kynurenine formamidase [Fundidesulfovibrio magnetotacticus]|uniref:Kynurenine formamidase n=1 Tax=Fundidesulfovibrio magnetotacticus TaxID=2730080 RepID=A0A6V8LSN8_9BACT|nr:cyclase family protein [Fundidesulfovibrio magnetotacticus]GFK95493.1 Kynurenine formamidase [Fundidesulfovibrio magnetotacticus]